MPWIAGKALDMLQAHIDSLMAQNEHLTSLLNYERSRADAERDRANRALDAMQAIKGYPQVTPPVDMGVPDLTGGLEEDPDAVAKVEERIRSGDASVYLEAA